MRRFRTYPTPFALRCMFTEAIPLKTSAEPNCFLADPCFSTQARLVEVMSAREVQINAASLEEGVFRAARALATARSVSLAFQYEGVSWSEEASTTLDEKIMSNNSLAKLGLCFQSKISLEGAQSLLTAVKGHPSLATLRLVEMTLGQEGPGCFAAILHGSRLTELCLEGAMMGDGGLSLLLQALQDNPALQSLDLCANGVGPSGATLIAEYLTQTRTLTALGISHNPIHDEGLANLLDAVPRSPTIQSLWLGANGTTVAGRERVVHLLRSNRLTTFGFSQIDRTEGEVDSLCEASAA